jgi:serine/threonine protein kinase
MAAPLPCWEPLDYFSYPVAEIPAKQLVPGGLTMEDFSNVQHIADGSNSNIFTAEFKGETVVIKMVKEEMQADDIALQEFDVEHGMLARLSHPNILKIYGVGSIPRRFIVLEFLGGLSLSKLLNANVYKPGLSNKVFRKPSFTYSELLSRAKSMAEALAYLHGQFHSGACILHRG